MAGNSQHSIPAKADTTTASSHDDPRPSGLGPQGCPRHSGLGDHCYSSPSGLDDRLIRQALWTGR